MADAATLTPIPPARRPDLILRPVGGAGEVVVKDPVTNGYFNLGPQEAFLLARLDGTLTVDEVCHAFRAEFQEAFGEEDLDGFIDLARAQGFLQRPQAVPTEPPAPAARKVPLAARVQTVLFWKKRLIDPDNLLNGLEPRLRFLWTGGFLALSLAGIALALVVFLTNRAGITDYLPTTWEKALLAWLVVAAATTLHELAHGLTCKHHGGEVREIGFLMMFFMPCLYCDVSDAWLLPRKAQRLWVTLAGSYCDLCVWAAGVFVWRLTLPGTLAHDLAAVIIGVCGARVIFNFIPFIKLDGYYLLSDWLEIPNLKQRAQDHVAGHLRRLLWGAARPDPDPRGRALVVFGLTSWVFSAFFLATMLIALFQYLHAGWGMAGAAAAGYLAWLTVPALFQGVAGGEVMTMLTTRHARTAGWALGLTALAGVLIFVPMEDRAVGTFKVRPVGRAEVRAPVSGFLQMVHHTEGDEVGTGVVLVTLDVPDLPSRLAGKRAELAEARAKLRLLETGTRQEEVREQREKVLRANGWRDLAAEDLKRKRTALDEELTRLDEQVGQHRAEKENAHEAYVQSKRLFDKKALSQDILREAEKRHHVAQAQLNGSLAQKRERLATGTQEAAAELARREKEVADARSALTLLEAGTRPEEIEAGRANVARLQEEAAYLERVQDRLRVPCPLAGVVTTPHLREKVGQFFKDGDLICEVETLHDLAIEVPLPEQEIARVRPGQPVELKARALPFDTFGGEVQRLAPAATRGEKDVQSTLAVYCRLTAPAPDLRPGMTGFARIGCGERSVGAVYLTRALRYLRTEFWW